MKLKDSIILFYLSSLERKRRLSEDEIINAACYLVNLAYSYKKKFGEKFFAKAVFISGRLAGASVKECEEFLRKNFKE